MDAKESHAEPLPVAGAAECLGRDECCPLCGGDNRCRVAKGHLYKGACWCHEIIVPGQILNRLAADWAEPACLCRSCLETAARVAREFEGADVILAEVRRVISGSASTSAGEDFYLDENGNTVFTEAFHRKRGSCCGSGCRHCPY